MSSILDYAVKETDTIHLRDASEELMYAKGADGKPDECLPMRVTVYGPGSKAYAKANTARSNRMMDRLKKKGKADMTADEQIAENAKFLAAVTHSFENIGMEPEALYAELKLGFVADQVNKHLGEWGNFTNGSTKT